VVLVLAWVAWVALAWWTSPRPSSVAQLQRDRAAGTVNNVIRSDGRSDNEGARFWGARPSLRSAPDGSRLVWQTGTGRTRYVDLPDPATAEALERQVLAADARSSPALITPGQVTAIAAGLMLVFLLTLISGPTPVRGTRWFWFWVSLSVFGLGVLAWLAFERPWATASARPDRRRRGGWTGLGYGIFGSLVIAIVVGLIGAVLPKWLVPDLY
jgi:hypothetical protein